MDVANALSAHKEAFKRLTVIAITSAASIIGPILLYHQQTQSAVIG